MKKIHKIIGAGLLAFGLAFAGCSNAVTDLQNSQTTSARAAAYSAIAPWAAGTSYSIGDKVTYNGKIYQCRLAHTALDGWQPDGVPALWLEIGVAEDEPVLPPDNPPAEDENPGNDNEDETVITVPGLPKHILTGYWQNFNNGAKVLRISEVPETYNLIVVSFADATGNPGEVTFNLDTSLGFSEAQFIQDIKTVQARGQHVIISVGGETGNVTIASDADANRFATSVTNLMRKYGFEGVDIDLEHGIQARYIEKALRAIPSGSIITFAPQTLDMQGTGQEYFKLALAIKDILTVNNTQYYNSGTMCGYDGKVYAQGGEDFLTALATIQLENGLRADQVGLGLPASTRGAGSGYVDPQIVVNALDTLAYGTKHGSYMPPRKYPNIRGAMTWSINWDASNGWNFSKVVGAKLKAMNEADGGYDNGNGTIVIPGDDDTEDDDTGDTPGDDSGNEPPHEEEPSTDNPGNQNPGSETPSTEVPASPKASGIPGTPFIEQSTWNGEASFGIKMNMWWGNNGTLAQLYENGNLIASQTFTDNSPNAQSYVFNISNKANGTYAYQVKLSNSFGTAASNTVNYTVTKGSASTTPVVTPQPQPEPEPEPQPGQDEEPPVINPGTGSGDPVINKSLPKRIMSGYWHTWDGGCPYIRLADVDSSWDVINVSFAEPVTPGSGNGRMKFGVAGDVNQFKADIKTLQAKGKKIVLSIGGYEGYFYLENSSAVNTFVNDIKGFINEYGFDGIDIDLEQSSVAMNSGADPDFANPKTPRIVNMINAIRQICDSYGDDFILSWAPETFYMQLGHTYYGGLNGYVDSRAGGYIPMIHALRDKTTYVQVQLYNSCAIQGNDGSWYSMGDEPSLVEMCEMLIDGFYLNGGNQYFFPGLRADQVVIAVPSSSSAAGSGQVSNEQLQGAFRTLEAKYPGMRGFMTWSINWDAYQNNNSFGRKNRAFLNNY